MQVVSSTEFATHQQKYFNLALSEEVFIKNGNHTFQIIHEPSVPEQPVLQPDEDLRRAITARELKERMHVSIRKFFADKP